MEHIEQKTCNDKNSIIMDKVYDFTIHAIFEILENKPNDETTKDCGFMDVFLSIIANTLSCILWKTLNINGEIPIAKKIIMLEDFIDNLSRCSKELFLQADKNYKSRDNNES